MFRNLKNKWKVNIGSLLLILLTFALGGSCTGYLGRKVLALAGISNLFIYTLLYIIIITLLWPALVLLISLPLGQFPFFKLYIRRVGRRLAGQRKED